jgi:gamma-glutamyltranspeptidase
MAAPRLHVVPRRIDLESRPAAAWPAADVAALRALGFTVQTRADAPYFARVNAIARDPSTGEWIGVADPRWSGAPAAPRER